MNEPITESKSDSTKSYENPVENADLTEEEQKLLNRLKQTIQPDLDETGVTIQEDILIRFVRGYFYETPRFERTLAFLRDHIKTRKEMNLDNILATVPPKYDLFQKTVSEVWHKFDRYGHPVKIISLRKSKIKNLKIDFTESEIKLNTFYNMELLLKKLRDISTERNVRVYKVLTIIDFTDIGVWSGLSDMKTLVSDMTGVLENNYPEIAFKTLLVNSKFMLRSIIKMLLLGANKYTKKKIITSAKFGNELLLEMKQYISGENIPKYYGGDCTCEECSVLEGK